MNRFSKIATILLLTAVLLSSCAETAQQTTSEGPAESSVTATLSTIALPTSASTADEPTEPTAPTVVTPTPAASTVSTEAPFINALSDVLEKGVSIVLPKEHGVYLEAQSDALIEKLTAHGYTVGSDGGYELHFGLTSKTDPSLAEGLDNADYTIVQSEKRLTIAGGSDYALGVAVSQLEDLLAGSLELPYTYRAPKEEQVAIIRTASFNIQNGVAVAHDFKRMAEFILSTGAEIIGIQEVDYMTDRNGGKDTMAELAQYTGYEYYGFSKAISFSGGEYGSGILSKYPILSYKTTALPGAGEKRSYGHAVIDVNGVIFDYYNTHLTLDDEGRRIQWATIAEEFLPLEHSILTGDLNRDGTDEYDKFFGDRYNYVNGNNYIGFEEGCVLLTGDEVDIPDAAAMKETVLALYALENGQSLEGTYTLSGRITGVVNTYPDSDAVSVCIQISGASKYPVRCIIMQGEGLSSLKPGDIITVRGTLTNLIYKNDFTPDSNWYDSCPGWGALDNIISNGAFFTQLDYGMIDAKRYSDHHFIYADLAYPRFATEKD